MPIRVSAGIESEEVARALAGLDGLVNGHGRVARNLWRDLALLGQRVVQKEFRSSGKRSGGWKDVKFATRVLRVKGKRRKYRTREDVMRSPHNPLRDTGALGNSWIASKAPHSIKVTDRFGEAGTSLKYADLHQTGGLSEPFEFKPGSENWERFKKNVAAVLPGKSKGGGKNWNPEFFKMRAALKKMHGRRFKVPARPMVPANYPNSGDRRRIAQVVKKSIDASLNEGR